MHTQVDTAGWIRDQGGHYVLTPLGNQKTLRRTLKNLPWKNVPAVSSVDTSHGRRVRRTVKAAWAPAWVDFPAAAQVLQVRRTRTTRNRKNAGRTAAVVPRGRLWRWSTWSAPCPRPMLSPRPSPPGSKGTGESRTGSTSVRDVVTGEDRHQLRTAHGPFGLGRPTQPGHPASSAWSRPRCRHRLNHQIPVTTTQTSHQAHHPTNHLNQLCRPPALVGYRQTCRADTAV